MCTNYTCSIIKFLSGEYILNLEDTCIFEYYKIFQTIRIYKKNHSALGFGTLDVISVCQKEVPQLTT